jgi:hypothetical protein
MDPANDPNLITIKVTVPGGGDAESVIRKFKLTPAQIVKENIHKTVSPLLRLL